MQSDVKNLSNEFKNMYFVTSCYVAGLRNLMLKMLLECTSIQHNSEIMLIP
jgi:hypothetical protein